MAELGALDIAKSLLEQLSSPAKDELLLWWNSKNELKKLKDTISTIKDVLHDAGRRQGTDVAVRGWILRLRDVLYEADDVFDIISTRALRKRVIRGGRIVKSMRLFFSESNHLIFTITIAHQVKDLRQRLDDVANDINWFRLVISAPVDDERPARRRREQSHSYVHEDDVVGRQREKKEILSMLLADAEGQESVSVIAVVGIGGLGKTTLAQYVYNAMEVKEHFDLQLWASVKYFSDLNAALEKIIASGTEEKQSGGLELDQLQNMLRRKISGKKFLLVLDDVWERSHERWLSFKALLHSGESGNKVLVTTRLKEVAENVATVSPWYALGELSDEHAWLLFKRMAFDPSQEGGGIEEKEELGKQIVKKCSNVPLAVRTIGSFLYRKDNEQWSKFAENELMKLVPDQENMIMQALKISYDDLPVVLKHCFAYFSLIPKGGKFDKSFMTQLWAAHGLLQTSSENPCLEDVGENYFLFLLERCFIRGADKDDINGRTTDYKMHDLFHDLAVEIAGKEFLQVTNIPDDFQERSPRHVNVWEFQDSLFEVKGMRSLLLSRVGHVERPVLDALFLHLTSLRVLRLAGLDVEEIPSSIQMLVHLRYLDLSWNSGLIKLPAAVCKLQCLLTLCLRGCTQLKKLPDDLHKLICLRHLKIESCDGLNLMPSGLKELTSLVTLDRLVVNKDHATLRCLKHLNNLTGSLEIVLPRGQWRNCIADAEESMLSSKRKLTQLSLSCKESAEGEQMSDVDADALLERLQPPNSIDRLELSGYPGKRFPEWASSLKNLVKLHLDCSMCVKLPRLSQLYHLKRLELLNVPLVEYLEEGICNDTYSFFPSLEYLLLRDMPRLKEWWKPSANEDHLLPFTKLSELGVYNYPQLTHQARCPILKTLHIRNVNVNLFSELVDGLVSIQTLIIDEMPNLKRHFVLIALQRLTALEVLSVRGICKTDSSVVNEDTWKSLSRLKRSVFEFGCDAQGSLLLNGLLHLTSLHDLFICGNLPANDIDNSEWTPPPNLKRLATIGLKEVGPLNRLIQQLQSLSTYISDL